MCALCRKDLTEVEGADGTVLGEEAHIVGRHLSGPRGDKGDRSDIDGYDNLILLCADDHKRIDSQPERYSVAFLLQKKATHEAWAAAKFKAKTPRIVAPSDEGTTTPMSQVFTGKQVWELVEGAAIFDFQADLSDDQNDLIATDRADEFLDVVRDTAEISADIRDQGFRVVREVQRSLQELLEGLGKHDLLVFGCRLKRTLIGGIGEPMSADLAALLVLTAEEARERASTSAKSTQDAS